MNFNVVAPLAFTSALSITVSLYYHSDIQSYGEVLLSKREQIQNVNTLPLPVIMKKKVHILLQPVATEIEVWLKKFHSFLYRQAGTNHVNLYQKLSWTPLGTINYKRTAENFILSGSLSDIQAFALASTCGNVDHIFRLWPIVKSKINMDALAQIGVESNSIIMSSVQHWVSYFIYQPVWGDLEKKEWEKQSLRDTNAVGTAEFFIQKIEPQMRKLTVASIIPFQFERLRSPSYNVNMFLFLMSQLDEASVRGLLFQNRMRMMNYCLKKWPLQQFLKPLTELLCYDFYDMIMFECLFTLATKIGLSLHPDMYRDIWKTLCFKMPHNMLEAYFVRQIIPEYLSRLFMPYKTEYVITHLFKEPEDALIRFQRKIRFDVSAVVLNILFCDNLHEVVKDIFLQQFPKEVIDDFDKEYAMYTKVYTDEYNDQQYV